MTFTAVVVAVGTGVGRDDLRMQLSSVVIRAVLTMCAIVLAPLDYVRSGR